MRRPINLDNNTQLLLRAQRGDVQAFAELHAALVPLIRNYIASLDGKLSVADHDDLVHETISAVWQNLSEYRGEASATTFAMAIARNLTFKQMSKLQRSKVIYAGGWGGILDERESCERPASLCVEPSEVQARIQTAMAQLTDVQRQAIELDVIRGLPRPESLKLANCNPNQFQKRLQRGMETLRRLLHHLRVIAL